MTTIAENLSRTIHLPTETAPHAVSPVAHPSIHKSLRLTDLHAGETARVVRLSLPDVGCRKRFAELGLAEGMKVTVATTGETLMLIIGGARMGVAARCAEAIHVARIPAVTRP